MKVLILIVVFAGQPKEMPFKFIDRPDMTAEEQCKDLVLQYKQQGKQAWCEQKLQR